MAKIPTSRQGIEFQVRPGVPPLGPDGWHGVNTESDPGSLNPDELQRGDNIRLLGGDIRARAGQSQSVDFGLAPGPNDNHVMWMGVAPTNTPRVRLWLSAQGCFGTAIGTGSTIQHIDPAQVPVVQSYAQFFTSSSFQAPLGTYGGRLFVGDRDTLREMILVTSHVGVPAGVIAFSPSQTPVARFPGFAIRCLREFDSKLFVGLENLAAPGASKIAVWDGIAAKDDKTAIRPPLNFGPWRDKIVAGFDATAGNIQVRPIGDAPGTWTAFALAGFQTAIQGNAMAEERQYLYIASGIDKLFRFDGAALTLARTIAGCAADGFGCTAVGLHRGLLYYGWNDNGGGHQARIGRHDPDSTSTEWVDTYKDVTANQANFIQLSSMLSYRSQLYCGGQKVWVIATAKEDVKGVVEVINNNGAPGAGFDVMQLIRHP